MKSILFFALILLSVSASATESDQSAKELLARINKVGASAEIDELTAHPSRGDWERVLQGIATGDSDWLDVAGALGKAQKVAPDEERPMVGLEGSVVRAIPYAPERVLELLAGPFRTVACDYAPHNATRSETLGWASASIAALSKVNPSPELAPLKKECLHYLQEAQADAEKWPQDPPEELVPLIRDLAELLSDGYSDLYWQGVEYVQYKGRLGSNSGTESDPGYIVLFSTEGQGGGNGSTQYLAYFSEADFGGRWTVKHYTLNSYLAVGGRAWRSLKLKSVTGHTVTLEGKEQTADDAMCCPSKPVTVKIEVKPAGLQYMNPNDA